MSDESMDVSSNDRGVTEVHVPLDDAREGDSRVRELEAELEKLREESEKMKKLWSDVETIIRPGESADTEGAIRRIMREAGYSTLDIENYLAYRRGLAEESYEGDEGYGEDEGGGSGGRGEAKMESGNVDEVRRVLDEVKAGMMTLADHQASLEAERLMGIMNKEVDRVVEGKDVGILVEALTRVSGEGDGKPRRESIAQEIRETARNILRRRKAESPSGWRDGWIREAVDEAASSVVKKFRSLVGDPMRHVRANQPNSPIREVLEGVEPVPPPVRKKGADVADVDEATKKWAVDYLLRGAAQESRETAV